MKEAVMLLARAWDKILPQTIKKCWHDILNVSISAYDSDDNIPLARLVENRNNDVEVLSIKALKLLHEINPQVN